MDKRWRRGSVRRAASREPRAASRERPRGVSLRGERVRGQAHYKVWFSQGQSRSSSLHLRLSHIATQGGRGGEGFPVNVEKEQGRGGSGAEVILATEVALRYACYSFNLPPPRRSNRHLGALNTWLRRRLSWSAAHCSSHSLFSPQLHDTPVGVSRK